MGTRARTTAAAGLTALAAAAMTLVAPAAPAQALGDDYPYRADTTNRHDPWGFTKRQCVSFVAWELHQRGKTLRNSTQRWGHARDWDDAARRLRQGIGTRPVVGAVAHWNAHERSAYYGRGSSRPNGTLTAGAYGHVGIVRTVYADGSAAVEQYNLGGSRAYSVTRVKAPRYLYVR